MFPIAVLAMLVARPQCGHDDDWKFDLTTDDEDTIEELDFNDFNASGKCGPGKDCKFCNGPARMLATLKDANGEWTDKAGFLKEKCADQKCAWTDTGCATPAPEEPKIADAVADVEPEVEMAGSVQGGGDCKAVGWTNKMTVPEKKEVCEAAQCAYFTPTVQNELAFEMDSGVCCPKDFKVEPGTLEWKNVCGDGVVQATLPVKLEAAEEELQVQPEVEMVGSKSIGDDANCEEVADQDNCDGKDVNRETTSQLKKVNGIRTATAQAIVRGRPYTNAKDFCEKFTKSTAGKKEASGAEVWNKNVKALFEGKQLCVVPM